MDSPSVGSLLSFTPVTFEDTKMAQVTRIGQWAIRRTIKMGWRTTYSHRVESEIEDRVVTKCGRQMRLKNSQGVLDFEPMASSYEQCSDCK